MQQQSNFDLFNLHAAFAKDSLLLYKGPFDKNILVVFRKHIDGILNEYPTINKKVFAIFIELAQNIIYYSSERSAIEQESAGIGSLAICEKDDSYSFITGNLVDNNSVSLFLDKCATIKQLNRDELREFKRQQLHLPSGQNDTANIGLIQVALTADGKFDFYQKIIDDKYSFITITVDVKKINN